MIRGEHVLGVALLFVAAACGANDAAPADAPDGSTDTDDPDASSQAPDAGPQGAGCIAQLAVGGHHSCALRTDGALWCWGSNWTAQLNDDSQVNSATPRLILEGVVEVASGYQHACAIDQQGALWCWGRNAYGQIGNGSYTGLGVTAHRVDLPDVVALGLGSSAEHTCARDAAGDIWCWGHNEYGQLGIGTTAQAFLPARSLADLAGVPVLGGHYSCGLDPSDQVACWGRNSFGATGTGEPVSTSPAPAVGATRFSQLSAGGSTTCGVKDDRSAWCWGDGGQGQLGDRMLQAESPVELLDAGVDRIRSAGNYVCALRTDRTLWCWGKNQVGQLGTGTTDVPAAPTPTLLTDVVDMSLGISHACALTGDGVVSCWGYDDFGQLGRGAFPTTPQTPHPTPEPTVAIPCP